MTTNYHETFITAAPDSKAGRGTAPAKPDGIAGLQYAMISQRPYAYTSDDVLFEVHAARKGIQEAERAAAREAFFARPQACLRASPLVKQFGWGIHHDAEGRIALYGVETEDYRNFTRREGIKVLPGMRSKRG